MTTFLLIRHAATDWIGRGLAGRLPGVHLSGDGGRQAAELAAWLEHTHIHAIYASPLERTQETAAALAQSRGLEVQADPAFLEIDFGGWTGSSFANLEHEAGWRDFNQFRSTVSAPEGENATDVQARVVRGLEKLRARHQDQTVAIVSHGDVIKAAIMHYLAIPLDFLLRFEISPASVSIVQVHNTGPHVVAVNRTAYTP